MENYKIKVNDLEDSEKLKVLDDLVLIGYQKHAKDWVPREIQNCGHFLAYAPPYHIEWDRVEAWGRHEDIPELTLPQLRDLVVLHRNDVKDATHTYHPSGTAEILKGYLTSDDWFYLFTGDKWQKHISTQHEAANKFKPIQEQGLISGADVPRLIKDGQQVQLRGAIGFKLGEWRDLVLEEFEEELTLGDFINSRFEWRLKPHTIKLEIEIPAPFEPNVGEIFYYISDEHETGYAHSTLWCEHAIDKWIGMWRTEEEIKQVVASLKGIKG
ncbi:hypothetical protein [Acinetobacter higginsii]|uniref:hypothetical protein n=1 Tax=Acinetobacter higginsii TaxID=70347 RepID=UPI001F4A33AF|nr:hypothetical protein [Acinetobacter higginsii]MCH7380348.1 hypothetical protein [Acinetobacter higginsii]